MKTSALQNECNNLIALLEDEHRTEIAAITHEALALKTAIAAQGDQAQRGSILDRLFKR